MTEYVSRCPNCETSFKVSDSQLEAAEGVVRCGACLQVFDAKAYFVEAPIPDLFDSQAVEVRGGGQEVEVRDDELERPAIASAIDATLSEPDFVHKTETILEGDGVSQLDSSLEEVDAFSTLPEDQDQTVTEVEVVGGDLIVDSKEDHGELAESELQKTESDLESLESREGYLPTDTQTPQAESVENYIEGVQTVDSSLGHELRESVSTSDQEHEDALLRSGLEAIETDEPESLIAVAETGRAGRVIWWSVGSLLFFCVLGLQHLWYERHHYANQQELRPYFIQTCNILNCDVPDFSDLAFLKTSGLVVRSHPVVSNGLVVDALLRNEAPFRQPFPGLQLRFADINGRTLAQRTFQPDTYLAGEMAGLRYIPAATEVRLSIGVVDPGSEAVSYSMAAVASP